MPIAPGSRFGVSDVLYGRHLYRHHDGHHGSTATTTMPGMNSGSDDRGGVIVAVGIIIIWGVIVWVRVIVRIVVIAVWIIVPVPE